MLCDVCFRMLRGQDGRVWKGTYDLHFKHHPDPKSLLRSAGMNCGVCRVLHEELQSKLEATGVNTMTDNKSTQTPIMQDFPLNGTTVGDSLSNRSSPKCPTVASKEPQFNISAMLSVLDHPRVKDLYRLDFKIRHDRTRCKRTFILQKNGKWQSPCTRNQAYIVFETPATHPSEHNSPITPHRTKYILWY
jgi:hypothetical protein